MSTSGSPAPSARRTELLEAAYHQVRTHGLTGMSLRPLATAIGSSPRVLLYLFGSKEGLVRALLARARADELALLERVTARPDEDGGPAAVAARVWTWLARPEHRDLLTLWVEAYARSLVEPDGPWGGFARDTVDDWLRVLADDQPTPDTPAARAQRTVVLAVLRGALLDLLATGDLDRVDAAVTTFLNALDRPADLATDEA